MTTRARVLVVDDSPTMRGLIKAVLSSDPGIVVVGEAGDAMQARAAIKALNPDVITLDIEMPEMNGLDFLEKIMKLRPMPVIMVSTLTHRGAEATLAALEIGAFDCVGKPVPGDGKPFAQLAETVKAAARSQRHQPDPAGAAQGAQPYAAPRDYQPSRKIIGIGASTGGVEALIQVLSAYPKSCPPTLIVQHISGTYLPGLAQRLDRHCAAQVRPAAASDSLEPGLVLMAPGNDRHLSIVPPGRRCRLVPGAPVSGHRPSVDALFHSAATLGPAAVGVLLTGMGRDGAEGLAAIRRAGGWTIGQDEASSTVYGMPRAAFEMGAVAQQLPISRIGPALLSAAAQSTERSRHG